MRWFDRFRMAVLMLLRRQSETARLDDELQFHLDQQVKENIARGLAPDEARYAALRPSAILRNFGTKRGPVGAGTGWKNFFATCAMVYAPSRAHRALA
jgi:hypothetical protein